MNYSFLFALSTAEKLISNVLKGQCEGIRRQLTIVYNLSSGDTKPSRSSTGTHEVHKSYIQANHPYAQMLPLYFMH